MAKRIKPPKVQKVDWTEAFDVHCGVLGKYTAEYHQQYRMSDLKIFHADGRIMVSLEISSDTADDQIRLIAETIMRLAHENDLLQLALQEIRR